MKLNEERIRELAIEAINNLSEKADPDSIKKYIEEKISKESGTIYSTDNSTSGRAILTSFGFNHKGIVSTISKTLSENNCDILDISQKIMQEFFTMIMMIDISKCLKDLKELQSEMNQISEQLRIKIYLQHEDVFRFMHRI